MQRSNHPPTLTTPFPLLLLLLLHGMILTLSAGKTRRGEESRLFGVGGKEERRKGHTISVQKCQIKFGQGHTPE